MDKDFIDETNAEITDETAGNDKETNDHINDNLSQENRPKMKFCTVCGKPKPESARFCPECGRDCYGRSASDPVFMRGNGPMAPPPPMMNPPYQRKITTPPPKSGTVPGLISLIISLINFFIFGSLFTFISLPAVIILSVIVFKRSDGKAMAIISIVITIISTILFALYIAIAVKITPDVMYFVDHDREIVANYEENGEIPERYKKYQDKKYDKLWSRMGYDDFDDFFGDIVKGYHESVLKDKKLEASSEDKKVDDEEKTIPSTTEATTDFDHSGEDLVVLS